MKSRNRSVLRWGGLVLAVLAVLALAFALLDFRIARSQTRANTQGGTGTAGERQDIGQLHGQKLILFVEEQEPFSDALRRQLRPALADSDLFGEVEVVTDFDQQMPEATLVVRVNRADILYTPVFARADIEAELFYSSNGDLSFIERGSFVFQREEGDRVEVQSRQTAELADETIGVISGPAYMNHLARETVEAFMSRLNSVLTPE